MPTRSIKTPHSEEIEAEKWEKAGLSTREKGMISEELNEMDDLPQAKELTVQRILKIALDVCFRLRTRAPRWERFLGKSQNLKGTKFVKLEAYI